MTRKKMTYLSLIVGFALLGGLTWNLAARAAYESADYQVIESDGEFELRDYPDLILASTDTDVDSQGRDGSFMRLFRFISGANESEQKISMTTPVFMENRASKFDGTMGFVIPEEVAAAGVPNPSASNVEIVKRKGGRFAVIRFAGRMDSATIMQAEAKLRTWMEAKHLNGADSAESAGYDPPLTPGPLRRNEVLIRVR